jgi:hypothetical protein
MNKPFLQYIKVARFDPGMGRPNEGSLRLHLELFLFRKVQKGFLIQKFQTSPQCRNIFKL